MRPSTSRDHIAKHEKVRQVGLLGNQDLKPHRSNDRWSDEKEGECNKTAMRIADEMDPRHR
ncbi:hypothetical protein J3Q64DRAFT_1849822 [Phycomyces blakesleeanus]|uniref:Uncharacterized protein n=1 Tax=Phycomyces blakesleeanus TaxID=4837 RepID=A0ABR3AZF8_PHYBL